MLYGGRCDNSVSQQHVLSDVWLLGITTLTWQNVKTDEIDRPSYAHASTIAGSQLFVFGGIGSNGYNSRNLFALELGNKRGKFFFFESSKLSYFL